MMSIQISLMRFKMQEWKNKKRKKMNLDINLIITTLMKKVMRIKKSHLLKNNEIKMKIKNRKMNYTLMEKEIKNLMKNNHLLNYVI